MPVSAELPFPNGLDLRDDASFSRVWRAQLPQIAIPFMGLPALTVSTGLVGRVPVGVQVVSGRYREDLCLLAGEAIEAGGSSLRDYVQPGGELGYFQHAWRVYGREGEPCLRCPGPPICNGVARAVQGGRSTFYCPRLQS